MKGIDETRPMPAPRYWPKSEKATSPNAGPAKIIPFSRPVRVQDKPV